MAPYLSFIPDLGGMNGLNGVDGVDGLGDLGGLDGIQPLNQTIYLDNTHPETTTENLCYAIGGGVLQSIRYTQVTHVLPLYLIT